MQEQTLLERILSGLEHLLPTWSRTDVLLGTIILLLLVIVVLLFGIALQLGRIARAQKAKE